ncbi:hypothetical protein PCASD_06003 [Puccinia coronata f. sp. avenae]|uniref:Repressor of RNA polymerase III transcription MAF1 n=1 Tax=Puccinia coronata f. sp. avenae TaxID=200324 RepID=A0A2N5VA00_9BASI|nr:hypothetical protein PCASD_06003 [Puccinia coronata f. sp. avenae]
MKYLEIPELGLLASMLSDSSHSVRTMTRIEAYSCKSVASERKLMKSLEQEFTSDLEIATSSSSPDGLTSSNALESAFGRLDRKDCRKTFWLLIATLNAAYPDHNFSRVKVEDFQAESSQAVLTKISEALELDRSGRNFASTLGALSTSPECLPRKNSVPEDSHSSNSSLTAIHPLIRQVLDPVIDLSHCEVYAYSPDADSDPHAVVSDDEEEVESVASSIYGSNRHDPLQHSYSAEHDEETMWEIEGLDSPSLQAISKSAYLGAPPVVQAAFGVLNLAHAPRSSSADLPYEEESTGGLLWSSHYFFYNRKMKRILFISTWVRKAMIPSATINESAVNYPAREQADYLLHSHTNRSLPTMADDNPWEQHSARLAKTSRREISAGSSRLVTSHLSKRLDSAQKSQPSKRTVDRSEAPGSPSSLLSLSRPQKKKKSISSRA